MSNSKIKINLDSLKTRREWKRHKVKDGHNIFRIGPPHGESSNGYAYRKWQIIWGLVDPESGRARPFASSMTSEKRCPVTEYVAQLTKKAETIKLQFAGQDDDVIKERLAPLNKLINDLKPKTVYLYNAIDKSGELGLLELKSTAHKKMKTEMSQYVTDYNQDPTSLNSDSDDSGVWFDVIRTGEGRDTEYDVKKNQNKAKKATGGFSYEDDLSPLPDSVVANYSQLAYDLNAVYQVKSYDDLQEILLANIPNFVESCPDADLDAAVAVEAIVLKSKPAPATKAVGKTVTTRFDDVDDDAGDQLDNRANLKVETVITQPKRSKPVIDDSFMAEANALLEE